MLLPGMQLCGNAGLGHQGYLFLSQIFALHEARSFPTHCVPVVRHNSIRIPLLVGLPSLLPPRLMRPHCHIPTTHSVPNSNHTNIAQCCRPYACLIPMRLFDVSQAGWVQALSLVGDSRPVIPTPARCAAPSPRFRGQGVSAKAGCSLWFIWYRSCFGRFIFFVGLYRR